MELPTQSISASRGNPTRLLLFGHTKVGKTTLLSSLPNCLLIDLEGGSNFVTAMKIDVNKIAKKENKLPITVLKEISEAIKKSPKKYDYIAIDTATALEEIATDLATIMYKNSPLGKSYIGNNVVTDLPKGAGYNWLRIAFDYLYKYFDGLAEKGLIITGHVKNSSLNKDGKELEARDLYLTGKLKNIVCQNMDAIGYVYRDKEDNNKIVVSFKTKENDLATGARPPHLLNQEFVLSEMKEDGTFEYHWDKIFLPEDISK